MPERFDMTPYRYIAAALVALAFIAGAYWRGHANGANGVQVQWQAERIQQEQAAEATRLAHQEEIDGLAKGFALKAAKQRVITQTITREVDKYVPNTLPMLPGGFRVLHDAAATGQEIDDSGRADAFPVAPKDVAATVAENYAECRYDQARLEALQAVVRAINGGGDAKEKAE